MQTIDSNFVLEHLRVTCPSYVSAMGAQRYSNQEKVLKQVEASMRSLQGVPNRTLLEAAADCLRPISQSKYIRWIFAQRVAANPSMGGSVLSSSAEKDFDELREKFLFVAHVLFVPSRRITSYSFYPFHYTESGGIHGLTIDGSYPFIMDSSGNLRLIGLLVPNNGVPYDPVSEVRVYAHLFPRRKRWWSDPDKRRKGSVLIKTHRDRA
jgi:hypothetical protein